MDTARKQLISEQEEEITANTKINAEVAEAKSLIENFLLDCRREGLAPTIDIGQLRRDRWRQWKRIPTEYRQHAPLKNFKLTPGYFFETSVAKFKDEYCLAVDGSLYKHQLNASDPFPLEELVGIVPVNKLAEALTAALLWLLKTKQQPSAGQETYEDTAVPKQAPANAEAAAETTGSVKPKRGLKLPFSRGRKSTAESAAQETVEISGETEAEKKPASDIGASGPAGVTATATSPSAVETSEGAPATEVVVSPKPEPDNGSREKTDLHLEKTTT